MAVPYVFVCPRCLAPSASEHDARDGYCGACSAYTAAPGALAVMPARDYYRWTRACRSYGVPAQRVRRLGQVPPEMPLTPLTLLEEPCWVYEGTEGDGQVAVFRFDPLQAPWAGAWRPEGLGWMTASWEHGNTLRLRVRAETMARAVMELIQAGPVSRSWSWPELQQLHEQARTARYLALREAGHSSAQAEALASALPPSVLEQLSASAPEASFRYQVEQMSVQLPPGSLAGLMVSAEGLAELGSQEVLLAGYTEMPAVGRAPDNSQRGEVFQQVQPIPDRAPAGREFGALAAPNEGGMDSDTAARTDPEDYADPERIFL
jgi:hypothetical protein